MYLPGFLAISAAPPSIVDLAVGQVEQYRLGDDVLKLVHHLLFELVGALRQRQLVSVTRLVAV